MRVRAAPAALALATMLGGGAVSPAGAQDDYGGLPEDEGRDIVYGICSGCHSIRLVTQQGMSRPRWDALLDWMMEKQGMPELDPETRDTVLDYLAEHYGQEARDDRGLSPFNQPAPLIPAQ